MGDAGADAGGLCIRGASLQPEFHREGSLRRAGARRQELQALAQGELGRALIPDSAEAVLVAVAVSVIHEELGGLAAAQDHPNGRIPPRLERVEEVVGA